MVREKTIVTMGTNGKTTTNSILYHALKAEGKSVIINRTGANMLNGIISAFVLSTDRHGQLDADYACIEVDEIASVGVLPQLKPDCALLTNISRDQLDRFGEVDITYNKLKTAVTGVPDTKLIINCDDILSYALAKESQNPFVTYGDVYKRQSMTITRPAYIFPYCTADLCAAIRFISPTGSVFSSGFVNNVMEMMYSFQNARKLNKITVTILGFAIGMMIWTIVRKYPAPSTYAASS